MGTTRLSMQPPLGGKLYPINYDAHYARYFIVLVTGESRCISDGSCKCARVARDFPK